MDTLSWQLPLLLAPIVGLLLISTSTRHQQIHREIHHLLIGEAELPIEQLVQLRHRVTLFRNALVALYISVSLLALGSLLGMILTILNSIASLVIVAFSSAGIISLLFASLQLVRESYLSLFIFHTHLDHIQPLTKQEKE